MFISFRTKCCLTVGSQSLVRVSAKWGRMSPSTPLMVETSSGTAHGGFYTSLFIFLQVITEMPNNWKKVNFKWFGSLTGLRKWCGMGQVKRATGKPTSTVKHGGRVTKLWPVWHRHCRVATSYSKPPPAAQEPASSSASRTPWFHPRNNLESFLCILGLS